MFKSDVLGQKAITIGQDKRFGSLLLTGKEFKSGKVGYMCSQAIQLEVGGESVRFQVSMNLVLAHSEGLSSEEKARIAGAKPALAKELVGHVVLRPREFASGKVGFGASEAVMLDVDGQSRRFQASVNITAAHSEGWAAERPAERPRKGERPAAG
jgi:hypothetical protein